MVLEVTRPPHTGLLLLKSALLQTTGVLLLKGSMETMPIRGQATYALDL